VLEAGIRCVAQHNAGVGGFTTEKGGRMQLNGCIARHNKGYGYAATDGSTLVMDHSCQDSGNEGGPRARVRY
jgi:hypothetical protein